MPVLPILTEIRDRKHFAELLQQNQGLLVIKFGAEWCGPCKAIEGTVKKYFESCPANTQCMIIDVDECFDVYAFLKTKKVVNGIPVLLCYKRGNVSYIPDDVIIGADKTEIGAFFQRCALLSSQIV